MRKEQLMKNNASPVVNLPARYAIKEEERGNGNSINNIIYN